MKILLNKIELSRQLLKLRLMGPEVSNKEEILSIMDRTRARRLQNSMKASEKLRIYRHFTYYDGLLVIMLTINI